MKTCGIVGLGAAERSGLMERLVAEFAARGFTVSTIKQTPAVFDVDQPGKDSFRHREAGATEVLLSSRKRWAQMHELRGRAEPSLDDLLAKLAQVDLVLIEGFADAPYPRLELNGSETDDPLIRVFPTADASRLTEISALHAHDTKAIAAIIARELSL